ncbi:MAG: YbaK/EbsC family protein [Anaerolineae bacterium]|nr:YbaK/EbsC family protein [Anaerolineae bacterium]
MNSFPYQTGSDDLADIPAVIFLRERNLPFSVFRHTSPPSSIEQAAFERGQSSDQVIRSILFKIPTGEFVMVLAAGPAQISWLKLRHYLGYSRLTMASHAEVLQMTGSSPGAVSPFGLPVPLRILADHNVLRQDTLSLGSGVRGTAIIIESQTLIKAIPAIEFGDFITHEP